jgi:hypothetical protein
MKKITLFFLTLILLCCSSVIFAQSDSLAKEKPQFKLSLNYNTGLNYYGRTDSLKSSGFFPLAEFWFSSHFYINAAPVFVNNRSQSMAYAGTVATAGYQQVSTKWLTSIFVTRPFYQSTSQLPQSALKAQGGINLSFLNKVLNINGGTDIKYSDKADYGASAGVDHLIKIQNKDNSLFILDPSFYTYAGTQNFTNTYYKQKAGFLFLPGTTQQVNETSQQFNVLAYECSLPIIYSKSKWQLLLTPSYIMPQHLITIPNHPEQSERGNNLFYGTVAMKYSF